MARVITPEEARERYLQKTHHISQDEYDVMFAEQGGCCKICGRVPKPGGRGLHVEHDHAIARLKVTAKMVVASVWVAMVPAWLDAPIFNGASRDDVKKQAAHWLYRKSIRGLVCWLCNAGLKSFFDNPVALRSAADYLDKFKAVLHTE